jgi:hypothetical protein
MTLWTGILLPQQLLFITCNRALKLINNHLLSYIIVYKYKKESQNTGEGIEVGK